jgi:putative Ig domain-containing protein
LQASGGTPPYTWSLASGPLPGGLQLNSGTGAISGTPTAAGPFGFVVVATDAGGQTAQKSLAITITAGLTITTGNLTGTVGSPFSQALSASGGSAPYTFALTGTLPAGLTFSASTDLISGTPTAAGTSTVTVTATDSAKNTASAAITITVNQAALPPVTFTIGTGSAQPPITLCLGSTFPSSVTGTLTAAFAPASSVAVGTDQSIQLILAGTTKGTGPTVTFIVPACGQTPPTSAMVTMGTVAGTITISATLNANGVNVTPSNLAPQTITVPAAPPVIQSVSLTQVSGSVTVSVIGYSSTREVISGVFNFAPATGSTLSQSSITVQLGAAYTTWYQSAASNAFGSLFQLTVPFTVSGSGSNIVAATVTLTNTKGTSAAVTSQ